uniref:Uncharacterized protein n=1 Tax=Rhizophora mucronata TaxID=61149 RepID=A0A2P2PU38_RHIMU
MQDHQPTPPSACTCHHKWASLYSLHLF